MKQKRFFGKISALLASLVLSACTSEIDLCTLLTLQEIQQLNSDAVSGRMETRHPNTPNSKVNEKTIKYCVWKENEGRDVLLLSAGLVPKNSQEDIFKFIYGDTVRVVPISGVGHSAVAAFSSEEDNSELISLVTHDNALSIDVSSSYVGDEYSESFGVIKDLAGRALERLN